MKTPNRQIKFSSETLKYVSAELFKIGITLGYKNLSIMVCKYCLSSE